MARISESVFRDWQDGDTVTAAEYKKEHKIIQTAINDNYDKILIRYTKAEIDAMIKEIEGKGYDGTTTLEDIVIALNDRYTKAEVDTFNSVFNNRISSNFSGINANNAKIANHENRIVLLEQRPTTAIAENVSVADSADYYYGNSVEEILAEIGAKQIGSPTKTVIQQNMVTLPADAKTVSLGLNDFKVNDSTLLVFQNSVLLTSNLYSLTDTDITLKNGVWAAGTELVFLSFVNVSSEYPVYQGEYIEEGTITNDKLANSIKIGDLTDLTIEANANVVTALNALHTLVEYINSDHETINIQVRDVYEKIGELSNLTTEAQDNLVEAINEIAEIDFSSLIGNLEQLSTVQKDNIVGAINELVTYFSTISAQVGNLSLLPTTDKTNIVASLTEVYNNFLQLFKAKTDGQFYRSEENPDGTTELKYDGYLTATRIYNAVYNDYAEFFEKDINEPIKAGDVVKIGEDGKYTKTTTAYDKNVVGVVSDEYAFAIGGTEGDKTKMAVGMAGRVHVKLKGKIKKGDLIVSSDKAGVAQKAEEHIAGTVIGKALEDKDAEGIYKIRMLILNA